MLFVHMLGKAQIDYGETQVFPGATRKFALLLHLWAERGRRVTREALQEMIFPNQTERSAGHSLRQMIYEVRRAGVLFQSDPAGIQLIPETALSDCDDLLAGRPPDIGQLAAIEHGFLPGYAPSLSEAFTEWLDGYRARVTYELSKGVLKEMDRAKTASDWAVTEAAARACLALNPMNERATMALAEVLTISGEKVRAVTMLDVFIDDLGARAPDLRLPAATLRRRISERVPAPYRGEADLPFVGRDVEMQQLRSGLIRARAGESNGVVVCGEAGIGKSRLASEFETLAALDGAHVHRIAVQPHDTDRPLGPFVDSIAALLELPGSLGCAPESMEALRRLVAPTEGGHAENEILAYESVFQSVRRAIRDLIDAITTEKCLVLMIDDAHWMDAVSTRIVMEMISGDAARRLLVVLTTREPARLREDFRHVDRLVFVDVRLLDPASTARLAAGALQRLAMDVDAELVEWMQVTSGGHPLFLATLVAHFRATRTRFAVPTSLRELLARRIDALHPRARTILQTCVLLGRHSTLARLTTTLTLPHIDLLEALSELDSGGLIHMAADLVTPAHPLISQTVTERTSPIATQAAHRRIATVLEETCGADELPAVLWDCAEHWSIAGESGRAHAALRTCAEHALALGRPAEAARILRRALGLSVSREEAIETARELVTTASVARENQLVLDGMAALRENGLPRAHDDLEFAEASASVGLFLFDSDTETRLNSCLLAREADPTHRLRAATYLLKLGDLAGRNDLAEHVLEPLNTGEIALVARELRLQHDLVRYSMCEDGDLVRATAHELLATIDQQSPANAWRLMRDVGFALWRSGSVEQAIATLERCVRFAIDLRAPRAQFDTCIHLSSFHLDVREDRDAEDWINRALVMCEDSTELRDDWSLTLARVDFAFAGEQFQLARQLLHDGEQLGVFRGSQITIRWKYALDMRLRAADGKLLASDCARARELAVDPIRVVTGLRDLEVAAACNVLDRLGQRDEAIARLRFYVKELRPRFYPLDRMLSDLRRRLESDQTVATGPSAT